MPSIQPKPVRLGRLLATLVMLLAAVSARSQELAFEPLVLPGLPSIRVHLIQQTLDGRMWFGNVGSLWVHDGVGLTEVSLEGVSNGPHRLRSLAPLSDGSLLLGLDKGLARVKAGERLVEVVPSTAWVIAEGIAADGDGGAWLAAGGGLLHLSADGRIGAVPLPVADCAKGVLFSAGRLWVWSAQGVWAIAIGTPGAAWQHLADFGVYEGASYGQRLLVVGERGLAAVDGDGVVEWLQRGECGTGVAVTGETIWLRGGEAALARFLPGEPRPRRVCFYHRHSPLHVTGVSALHVDDSGLLWIASMSGVWRIEPSPGIDHCVLPGLAEDERVCTFVELANGRMLLGTSSGRLLTAEDEFGSCWLDDDRPFGSSAISVLHVDAHGRLWAGTRRDGLWRREADGWRAVGTGAIGDNVRAIVEYQGDIVVCGSQATLRLGHDDQLEPMPFADLRSDGRMLPSCLTVDGGGDLWLGTFKNGLHRWDAAAHCFRRVAMAGEGVLRLTPAASASQVLASGIGQVYQVGADGLALRVPRMEHGTPLRELVVGAGGTLWGARPGQLLQLDGADLLEVGAGLGAHPLGYSFGGGAVTRRGDVWLGTSRGYTHVHAGASLRSVERATVLGFRLFGDGGSTSWHRPGDVVEAPPGFRIEPRIVARMLDLPTPCSVFLESATGELLLPSADGAFRSEVGERYRAMVEFVQVTGARSTVALGSVSVRAVPGSGWTSSLALTALALLLSFAVWRTRRRGAGVEQTVLVDSLRAIGQDPDSVLDLAFVVAAAAERAKSVVQATAASVWISVTEQPATLLMTFGPAAGDELDLAHLAEDAAPAPRGVTESDRQVMIRLPGPGGIAFSVLLSGLVRGERLRAAELEAVLAPARATLERRIWLERLQSSYVKSSLSLEAHLHDMRSALTSLRLGVGELRKQHGSQDPAVQSVGNAMDSLLQAVEGLRSRDAVDLAPSDPAVIVAEVVETLRPQAQARGLAVEVSGAGAVTGVKLDPVWFRRAVENAIGNALKYSPDGSRVEVSLRAEPERFVMAVDDQGPGIDAAERKRLFLPGVVGKAPPRNGEGKSGIGLWISRQAMRAMGGAMWIEPRTMGGTRVILQLPRDTTRAV